MRYQKTQNPKTAGRTVKYIRQVPASGYIGHIFMLGPAVAIRTAVVGGSTAKKILTKINSGLSRHEALKGPGMSNVLI